MFTAAAGYSSIRLDELSVHSSYEKKSPKKAVLRQAKSRLGKSLCVPCLCNCNKASETVLAVGFENIAGGKAICVQNSFIMTIVDP
jgi:hypothetical protein